jgi:hypothetical protein
MKMQQPMLPVPKGIKTQTPVAGTPKQQIKTTGLEIYPGTEPDRKKKVRQ